MIATRSIKIENVTVEQNTVAATMFGANTLQSVNTSATCDMQLSAFSIVF